MGIGDLSARLAQHKTFGSLPPYELSWLAEHGELQHIPRGEFSIRAGQKADTLWIVLSGHIAIYVNRGLGPRRVMEWKSGDVSGAMPYSRIASSPGDVIALEATDVLHVNRNYFPDMTRECPTATTALVHVMLDRTRAFTSSDLQDEKMVSLGRMAAGLAHELNNPASAARRSARLMAELMEQAENATRVLAGADLTEAQLDAIDRARRVCRMSLGELTPMARADREDALAAWLDDHGSDPELAGMLLDTGATPETLDDLGRALEGNAFDTAVRWVATCCSLRTLAFEIDTASSRIYDLVSAIKRFSYMDQAQAPEAIDLVQGIRDSVSLVGHKARDKSVTVLLDIQPDLPKVRAIGSDLNQVWTNLLDNAVDAAPPSGQVTMSAAAERGAVIVRVVDNGGGIPPEIRDRIFDPFFTTKGVGKGTGLGLEITRRLVLRNNGDIEVDSEPGRTEFRIMLQRAPSPEQIPTSQTAHS